MDRAEHGLMGAPNGGRHSGVAHAGHMVQHARAGLQFPIGWNVENVVGGKLHILRLSIQNAPQRNLYLCLLWIPQLCPVDIGMVTAEGVKPAAEGQQFEYGGVLHILKGKGSRPLHIAYNKYLLALRYANLRTGNDRDIKARVKPVVKLTNRDPLRAAVGLLDDDFRARVGRQAARLAYRIQNPQVAQFLDGHRCLDRSGDRDVAAAILDYGNVDDGIDQQMLRLQ